MFIHRLRLLVYRKMGNPRQIGWLEVFDLTVSSKGSKCMPVIEEAMALLSRDPDVNDDVRRYVRYVILNERGVWKLFPDGGCMMGIEKPFMHRHEQFAAALVWAAAGIAAMRAHRRRLSTNDPHVACAAHSARASFLERLDAEW